MGGQLLLVADAGSNQISVLRIHSDGSLSPVAGSAFPSGGNTPVSIAVRGSLVYVANQGNGGSNYTGFTLSPNGTLTPLPGSTVALPDGSGVGDVLIDLTARHLVGVRVATSLIDSFVIGTNGALTSAPGYPVASQAPGPLGSAFKGAGNLRLYVSNAHAGPLLGTISAYGVAANGALTPLAGSPYADQQTAPCWVTLSPDGKFLFTANAGSDSISSYAISADGSLTCASTTALRGGPGLGTFDQQLDPSGRYLYQLDGNTHLISILAVDGGSLTELSSSPVPLPAGGAPFGLTVI
jgi:6-phosphogluconolactonase (cycloisomerase 2 family)